jgi:hypothetical protein
MSLGTLGTNANNSLTSIVWNPMSPVADVAAIQAAIMTQNAFQKIAPGAFSQSGRLAFPGRRGFILLQPGDYVGVDSHGWPVLVSNQAIAAAGSSWTHNP